jgi:hypothetical protein
MRTRIPVQKILLAVSAACLPVAAEDTPHARLIQSQAGSVVTVKAALKITGNIFGRSVDQERDITASGVVIDACGFVMMPSAAVSPSFRGRGGDAPDLKVTPTNLRVIFAGDEKEYEAILGATDSKLGLAFVLIRDLKGRTVTPVDFTKTSEPRIGDTLYSITRLEQGFDYAPICDEAHVIGQVTKPRSMWVIQGPGADVPHPLYTAGGMVTGIVVYQEGVGDDAGTRPFLLPLKIATGTMERALKTSQKALEEANALPKEPEKPAEGDKSPEEKPADGGGEKPEGDK